MTSVGLPGKFNNPGKYAGDNMSTLPCVNFPRAPTDRDGEFPLLTHWRNDNAAAVLPDAKGDVWMLVNFLPPSAPNLNPRANWQKITTGGAPGGTVVTLSDTAGILVNPDVGGDIQLNGSAGITVTSNPGVNAIDFTLPGGGTAFEQFGVDAHTAPGTDPVVPTALGLVVIEGNQVAAGVVGANAVRTNSIVANTMTIEVQRSAAVGATAAANNGICHFNNANFTVDGNGFVSLAGGGLAIDSITVDTIAGTGVNPVVPDGAGNLFMTGGQVAAGTVGATVVETDSLSPNHMRVVVQRAAAVGATASVNNGVSHYNSAHFTCDANGFVSLTGGGMAIDSFTTTLGGPVAPDGTGNVAFTGATSTFTDGTVANTLRTEVQGTDHALFVGNGAGVAAATIPVGVTGELLVGLTGVDPAFAVSSDGDFAFTSATAGVDRTLIVRNTDNTNAASEATFSAFVGGGTAGDPTMLYTVNGVTSWTTGIDNSQGDAYKVAASSNLGTTDTAICTTAGEWTYPLQPAFLACLSGDIANVTGNAANYTFICNTEIFDVAADYNNATGTFTAPITGKYTLWASVSIFGCTIATNCQLQIVTSNRSYYTTQARNASAREFFPTISALCDMDAGDVANTHVACTGEAADTDDIGGNGSPEGSSFGGYLSC